MLNAINSFESSSIPYFPEAPSPVSPQTRATTPSTQRAALRRMRRETSAPQLKSTETDPLDRLEKFMTRIETLIRLGCYSKVLPELDEVEQIVDQYLLDEMIDCVKPHGAKTSDFRPCMNRLSHGLFFEMKAFIYALEGNRDAIDLCNEGFENVNSAVLEIVELAKRNPSSGSADASSDFDFKKWLDMVHQFFRGMLALSLDSREMAIDDLRSALQLAMEVELEFDPEFAFFVKALEQKLEVPLLPESMIVDEKDPKSLLMTSRYEEALKLLETSDLYNEFDAKEIRVACLALLGRHEEALNLLKPIDVHSPDHSNSISMIYLLKGKYEKAREKALNPQPGYGSHRPDFGYIVLLAIHAFEK